MKAQNRIAASIITAPHNLKEDGVKCFSNQAQ